MSWLAGTHGAPDPILDVGVTEACQDPADLLSTAMSLVSKYLLQAFSYMRMTEGMISSGMRIGTLDGDSCSTAVNFVCTGIMAL